MCFKTPKMPEPPPVPQAPQKDEAAASVQNQRRRMGQQRGMYGSVFTSVLGDSGYGGNVASLGASA